MKKFYSNLRTCFLVSLSVLSLLPAVAQTTVISQVPPNLLFNSASADGAIVFGIRNNNSSAINITDVANYLPGSFTGTLTLWYHPSTVTGAPAAITAANGWVSISTATVTTTSGGITPLFTNVNLNVPAGTIYRLAISGPPNSPYYAPAGSTPNFYTGGGLQIFTQDNPNSPGYGGGFPGPPANTPRGFLGSITFIPVNACSAPVAGQAFAKSIACTSTTVDLDLSGNSIGTGQTYQWQTSSTSGGTYTNIGSPSNSPLLKWTPTANAWYHALVTCGSTTVISSPVEVKAYSSLAGTYTINNTLPTNGTNFASFTDAVAALACGISGPVIFNVSSDKVFSEDVPVMNFTGTSTNTITFRKSGSGANPKITPVTPGTIASSTTIGGNGDGIVVINGGDYITFDGIDLETNPGFSGSGMMEYGYYLQKASATNACKNVVIKNSTITLNKAAIYSFGIFVSNFSNGAAVTVTSTGGRSENIKLSGNTITNAYGGIQLRGYAATATPYDLYDQNIEVGVDSANNIVDFGGGATAAHGIYAIYQNGLKIAKNTIVSATGTTSTVYGIFTTTGFNSNLDIYNNTITVHGAVGTNSVYGLNNDMGAAGTNNQVNIYNNTVTGSNVSATSGSYYAIYQNAAAYKAYIYGNTVNNNTFSPTTTGIFHGIYQGGAVVNEGRIYNNTVATNTKTTGTSGAFYCIWNSPAATANNEIYSNTVFANSTTGTTGILYGINQALGATSNVYKNNISNLVSNSTGGSVYALALTGGTTNNVYNNFISDLTAPTTSATADGVRGISVTLTTASSNVNAYFNSIFLSASSSGANFSSSGIFHTTSATATTASLTLKNNNVVNMSNASGTGKASAFRRSTVALGNYNTSSNYNNFYAGSPSSTNVIFYDGTNFDQDLSAYKARVNPIDNNSISENPPFINVSSVPYDLHLQTNIPTQLESGGAAIAGITDDIDGNPRHATSPDIGADEFTGTPTDLSPPNIVYTALAGDCNTGNRTIPGVTITDASGVPVTGVLMPRIYYRKGAGAWFSKPGTLTSGNATNGQWSFTIIASDMGGLSIGDLVSYYIVAQDVSPAASLTSNPVGAAGTNVNNITTHPSSPAIYFVGGALSGNYNVGSGGTFTTLTQAVNVYNASSCITQPVTFSLTDADYSFAETFPIVINSNPWASAANTLTIRSSTGNAATLNGTSGSSAAGLIKLNGADYIIIDSLNINVAGSATTEFGYGIQLVNDADNNTIKRCNITAATTPATAASTAFAGIVVNSSTSTSPIIAGNSLCDNNTITGNTITGGYSGITLVADGTSSTITGNNVTNNVIKDFYTYGIYLNGTVNTLVEGNDISRPSRSSVGIYYGTYMTTGTVGTKVSKNKYHNSFDGNAASVNTSYGVYTASDATTGNPNIISNNWVYAFNNSGTQYGFYSTGSDNIKYYYNSVLLDGPATTSTTYDTRGFYQTTAATGLEFKNNIVYVSRASIGENHALYIGTTTTTFTSDYNDFYVTTTTGALNNVVFAGGSEYSTLPAWQASTGNPDAHSLSTDPLFNSPTDLHLLDGSPLDDKGTPISSILTDIDDGARDGSTPDIGADEIPLSNGLDLKASALISPAVTGGCYNAEAVVVRIKNNSASTINFASNPVTVTVNITGAVTTTLSANISAGTLASGAIKDVTMTGTLNMNTAATYTFNASTSVSGDINTGNNAMPEATRTKDALSAGSTTAAPSNYCLTGGTPTLNAIGVTGSASVRWQQSTTTGSGFTDIPGAITNPYTLGSAITQTMYYRLVATCGTNNIISPESQVTLLSPQLLSTTPGSRCGTGTVILQATSSPGTSISWYSSNTSNTPIGSGTSFTTPSISANTTYYAGANTGGSTTNVGLATVSSNPTSGAGTTNFGIVFDAIAPFTLTSVVVYPVSGTAGTTGTVTIDVVDGNGAVVHTATVNVTGYPTASPVAQTVNLNFNIVPGTNYKLRPGSRSTGITGLLFEPSAGAPSSGNYGYPFSVPGVVNIVTSTLTGPPANTSRLDLYYYFYNWQITTGCESARSAVLARTDNCTFPVTVLNFKGERQGTINKLEWTTLTEINNKGFELERSADGLNFTSMAFVVSKTINGNSTSQIGYKFDDVRPLTGSGYYRLKQVDLDGRFTYSNIVLIKGATINMLTLSSIYPNPVRDILNMIIVSPSSKPVAIAITDASGKLIMQKQLQVVSGDNQFKVPVAHLAPGGYFIKAVCANGCETAVQKFVKF